MSIFCDSNISRYFWYIIWHRNRMCNWIVHVLSRVRLMHWRVHQFFIFRLIEFFRRYDSTWFWKLPALLRSAVLTPGLVISIRVIMFVRFQPIEVNNQFLSRSIYISYSVHNIIQCLHNDVWTFPGAMECGRSTSWYG